MNGGLAGHVSPEESSDEEEEVNGEVSADAALFGAPIAEGEEQEERNIMSWASMSLRHNMMRQIETVLAQEGNYLQSTSSPALRPAWLEQAILEYAEKNASLSTPEGGGMKSSYVESGEKFLGIIRNGNGLGIRNDAQLIAYFINPNAPIVKIPEAENPMPHIPAHPAECNFIADNNNVAHLFAAPLPNGDGVAHRRSSSSNDGEEDVTSSSTTTTWRDGKTIAEMFEYMSEHDEGTRKDVTFYVGPERVAINAHKMFLSLVSIVFDWALYESVESQRSGGPRDHMHINIENVNEHGFRMMIKYIYCRCISWGDQNVRVPEALVLLDIGKLFELGDLMKECVVMIKNLIDDTNATDILNFADTHGHTDLREFSIQFIITNSKRILPLPQFLKLSSVESLSVILTSDDLNMSEQHIFQRVLHWAQNRIIKRLGNADADVKLEGPTLRAELGAALYLIRFPLFTSIDFNSSLKGLRGLFDPSEELKMYYFWTDPQNSVEPFSAVPRVYSTRTRVSIAAATIPSRHHHRSSVGSAAPGSRSGNSSSDGEPPRKIIKREPIQADEMETSPSQDAPITPPPPENNASNDENAISGSGIISGSEGSPQAAVVDSNRVIVNPEMGNGGNDAENDASTPPTIPAIAQAVLMNKSGRKKLPLKRFLSPRKQDTNPPQSASKLSEETDGERRQGTSASFLETPAYQQDNDFGPNSQNRINLSPPLRAQLTYSPSCSNTSSPSRRSSQRVEPFLNDLQIDFIKSNMSGDLANNLVNYHRNLCVGVEDQMSQPLMDEIIQYEPIVINESADNLLPLHFPDLHTFRVKYLHPAKTVPLFKQYLAHLVIQNSIFFVKKSEEEANDLSALWISEINVNLEVNGVVVLNIDHDKKSITVSRIDKAAESIVNGLIFDGSIKQVRLEDIRVDLNNIPTANLEQLVLRDLTGGINARIGFIRECKALRELSIDTVGQRRMDLGEEFGMFGETGLKHLRKISLGQAKLQCSTKLAAPLQNSPVEELYLDGCSFGLEFVEAAPFVFPNLVKCKLFKTSNLLLVLQLLKIPKLQMLWVWELEFKERSGGGRGKSVGGEGQKMPLSYVEDKAKMKQILTQSGLGNNSAWLNKEKKTFLLQREISPSGNLTQWVGTKFEEDTAFDEFAKLSYEQFGWDAFYCDYHLFDKMNKNK